MAKHVYFPFHLVLCHFPAGSSVSGWRSFPALLVMVRIDEEKQKTKKKKKKRCEQLFQVLADASQPFTVSYLVLALAS